MKLLLLAVCLCSFSAYAQVPDCSSGHCAGVGAPSIAGHPGDKYAQVDAPGTNWTYTGVPPGWVIDAGGGGVVPTSMCSAPGMKCDGATDDTTALQNLINTIETAGGGELKIPCGKTVLLNGQIAIPKAATTPWAMSPLRIFGCGSSFGTADSRAVTPAQASTIDARFAGSRFISLGQGVFEIDHLNLVNGGSNCGVLFQTTLTQMKLHDNAFIGSTANGGKLNACDDVWIAGGTRGINIPLDGTVNDYFQGYGSVVQNNFADYIRSFVIGQVAFDSIPIVNNSISNNSGSNVTTAVTAATNAAAAVLTSTAHSFPVGTGITLTFSGFTGNWTPLNGAKAITVIDANTFSVAINSTAFGALTGTPVYLSGSAISIDGTATSGSNFNDSGNQLAGNLFEQSNYPFVYRLGISNNNNITGTSCWDITSASVACVWQQAGTANNFIQINHSGSAGVVSSSATQNGSLVFNAGILQSQLSITPLGTGTTTPIPVIQSGLATGSQMRLELGANFSNFNAGLWFFQYQGGAGSTANRAGVQVTGAPDGGSFADGLNTWNTTALRAKQYTVATLPTASSLGAGTTVIVTDATAAANPCVGGSTNYMLAITNGTTWSCH